MIRVAFCDDDAAVLTRLAALLDRYQTARGCDLCGTAFSSPLELLAEAERGASLNQHAGVMESGAEIPVPRGKVREIRDACLDCVFAQRKPVI